MARYRLDCRQRHFAKAEELESRILLTVAYDDFATVACGGVTHIDVLANDTPVGALSTGTLSIATPPTRGSATIRPNGIIEYESHDSAEFLESMQDEFSYNISDVQGVPVAAGHVTLIIMPGASAKADTIILAPSINERDFDVRSNDHAPLGDLPNSLGVTIVRQPDQGTASVLSDGRVRYVAQPAVNASYSTDFDYAIVDRNGCWSEATVNVFTQRPLPSPPIARDDAYSLTIDVDDSGGTFLNVLANDSGAGLYIESFSTPTRGNVSISSEGLYYSYLGEPFAGQVSFGYSISDAFGNHTSATVRVNVTAVIGQSSLWQPFFAPNNELPNVGDFNGDEQDDIIAFTLNSSQDVYVALNTGTSFGPATVWHDLLAQAGNAFIVGDFDGDGRDDVARFNTALPNHNVRVARSRGTHFADSTTWLANYDIGTGIPMSGDFNGDGLDDIIVFAHSEGTGEVWVALSTGNSFTAPSLWRVDFAPTGQVPRVGDFNGDGLDDIVTFTGGSRDDAIVALNRNGRDFGARNQWHDYFSPDGEIPRVIDVNDDGRDDIVSFTNDSRADVLVAFSEPADAGVGSFGISHVMWDSIAPAGTIPYLGQFGGDAAADAVVFYRGAGGDVTVAMGRVGWSKEVGFRNGSPDGLSDVVSVVRGDAVEIFPTRNDVDPDDDRLVLTPDYSRPTNGTLFRFSEGGLLYTPNPGFFGVDVFEYTVVDSKGASDTAVVEIHVANVAPQANDIFVDTRKGAVVQIDVASSVWNGNADLLELASVTQATSGLVEIVDATQISYRPQSDFDGLDMFSYTVNDRYGGSATGTIYVSVAVTSPVDFNADGQTDMNDIDALTEAIAAGSNAARFDVNGDGLVDVNDRDLWLSEASRRNLPGTAYLRGDANLDGFVDAVDLGLLEDHLFSSIAAWSAGDFNADGIVDASDFNLWNENKFRTTAQFASIAAPRSSDYEGSRIGRRSLPKAAATVDVTVDAAMATLVDIDQDRSWPNNHLLSGVTNAVVTSGGIARQLRDGMVRRRDR